MVATVMVTRAIGTSGQRFTRISAADCALKKDPCNTSKKCLSGLMTTACCNHSGMFSTGVAKPEVRMKGMVLLSTPNGRRGHFYESWQANEDWKQIEVPATECPRISQKFLNDERAALGQMWFEQEYFCRFVDVVDAVFRMDDIERSITDEVTPLFETPPGAVRPLSA